MLSVISSISASFELKLPMTVEDLLAPSESFTLIIYMFTSSVEYGNLDELRTWIFPPQLSSLSCI